MKRYILHVPGTLGKFDGYCRMFTNSKKAGKAFAKTIATGTKSALTIYTGNIAEMEITNY
mgnify:FL=1